MWVLFTAFKAKSLSKSTLGIYEGRKENQKNKIRKGLRQEAMRKVSGVNSADHRRGQMQTDEQ